MISRLAASKRTLVMLWSTIRLSFRWANPKNPLGPDPEVYGLSLDVSANAIVVATIWELLLQLTVVLWVQGLRAISTSRYSFGFYNTKLCSLLNIIDEGFIIIKIVIASGWCSIISDYYCNYPANIKNWKIFILIILGISFPIVFVIVIGIYIGNAVFASTANPVLTEAYTNHRFGDLLLEFYYFFRFTKFCFVLLVFFIIENNITVNYSNNLFFQLLNYYFYTIFCFVWFFINALVIVVLAIVGYSYLSSIVSNFVSLLGYWTVLFIFILLIKDI
ncbi:977def1a-cdc5-4567-a5ef-69b48364f4e5-CDS [Sclerotinia trifoliorum]|uniref:977def1a-cdc5-4567-a5ef-69b48364f4e5-CDS n=1 Tax=Sclerotinia trifoliorum TaxID=28548 RepID=A0A8H2VMK3_9HELO|nr:977def1a-cdc5-4567-a5ef-69b48364f4e5-CDS [Sclerotinia trifoliorum]